MFLRFRNMFCHYSSSPSGILTLLPRSLWSLVLPRSELESITSWWFSFSFDPYCSLFLLSQFYLFSSLQTAKQSGFFFLKIGFPKILAVSQSTRTSLKIRPSLVRFSDVLRPIELNIRKSELKKFICGVTWYFWEVQITNARRCHPQHPAYRDLGWKNRDLGNRASLPSHMNSSKILQRI